MNRIVLIPAFAALSACGDLTIPDFRNLGGGDTMATVPETAMAPVVPMSAQDRLVAAAEAQGCVISPDNAASVTAAASISTEELEQALLALVTEGLAAPTAGNALELKTANCAA